MIKKYFEKNLEKWFYGVYLCGVILKQEIENVTQAHISNSIVRQPAEQRGGRVPGFSFEAELYEINLQF